MCLLYMFVGLTESCDDNWKLCQLDYSLVRTYELGSLQIVQ